MNNNFINILFFLFAPCLSYTQTCVIAKIDKKCIFVGADTRETDIETNERTNKSDTSFSIFHKIGSQGNFHFVVMHEFGEESMYFAKKAAMIKKTFKDVQTDYYTNYTQFLRLKFDSLKKKNERVYHISYPYDSAISVIFFFGYENNKPVLNILKFINVSPSHDSAAIKILFYHDTVAGGGEVDKIKNLINNPLTWRGNTQKKICELIKIEAKEHPNEVAEPIDMIFITNEGSRMISKPCN